MKLRTLIFLGGLFGGMNVIKGQAFYGTTGLLHLIKDITEKRPDVVFVAMGSPKQELLMEEIQHRHKAIFQGLGGSFDVYTGHVERAPKWWVNHNLEFAYRLLKEPKRIKRQIHLIKYAWWLITKKL